MPNTHSALVTIVVVEGIFAVVAVVVAVVVLCPNAGSRLGFLLYFL